MMSQLEWINIFGDNMRGILELEYGISQSQLARECGLSKSVISKIVNKETIPSTKTVLKIWWDLGISIHDLIVFDDFID